jgi:phosphoribosylanthranilate isomerase
MWIKFCGTTNLEDAQASCEAGADALGFVFAPSKRRVSPKVAARITAQLPSNVEKIGVFLNQDPDLLLETARTAGLTGVQLHGDETPEYGERLKRAAPRLKIIKTIHMRENQIAGLELDELKVYDALLFDSGTKENRGGTGVTFDWNESAPLVRFLGRRFRVIVAGGLKPQNVKAAIAAFDPDGVVVVSGVEREPGQKDPEKLRAFVEAVRSHGEK